MGITALSENHFVASAAGEGELARTTPEEDLSAFGHVGSCFLDGTVQLYGGAETFFDAHQWELEAKDYAGVLDWIKRARRFSKDSSSGLWVPT